MTSFRCLLRPPSTAIDSRWCIKFLQPQTMSRHANKLSFVLFPRESAFDQSIECEYKFEWGRNGKASEGGEWHSSGVWEYSFFACNMLKLPARVNKCDSAGWKLKLNETLAMFATWTLPLRQLPSEKILVKSSCNECGETNLHFDSKRAVHKKRFPQIYLAFESLKLSSEAISSPLHALCKCILRFVSSPCDCARPRTRTLFSDAFQLKLSRIFQARCGQWIMLMRWKAKFMPLLPFLQNP